MFYTKLQTRPLQPLLEAHNPPAPIELGRTVSTIDRAIVDYITNARLGAAARNLSQDPETGRPRKTSV